MAATRVGSVTFGLTLVVFGVMFLLSAFIKSFNYLDVIKFWPVIFISLGIEMLVHAFSKNAEKAILNALNIRKIPLACAIGVIIKNIAKKEKIL